MATLAACLIALAPGRAEAAVPGACHGDDETAVVCIVNQARASLGLRELRPHPLLAVAAESYAHRMAREGFLSHQDPEGAGPAERLIAAGYGSRRANRPWSAGEALGRASGALASPQALVLGWLASPGHRRILLARSSKHVGVGIADRAGEPGTLRQRLYVFYGGRR